MRRLRLDVRIDFAVVRLFKSSPEMPSQSATVIALMSKGWGCGVIWVVSEITS